MSGESGVNFNTMSNGDLSDTMSNGDLSDTMSSGDLIQCLMATYPMRALGQGLGLVTRSG